MHHVAEGKFLELSMAVSQQEVPVSHPFADRGSVAHNALDGGDLFF